MGLLPGQGLLDGPSLHELGTEDAHGLRHGRTRYRLANPTRQLVDPASDIAGNIRAESDDVARQHQCPDRRIEEYRVRLSDMIGPIRRGDLLRDQRLGGVVVGNSEQGFADAHQGDALFVAQTELAQEHVEHGTLVRARPAPLHQADRAFQHAPILGVGKWNFREPRLCRLALALGTRGGNGCPLIGPLIGAHRFTLLLRPSVYSMQV